MAIEISKKRRIAILIPCFNSEKTLPYLFESINAQTIPFDEIICYDDQSTDNTISVAKALGAKVIEGKVNKGAAFARNRLIENTESEWVHFHDSDDLLENTFVERCHDLIHERGLDQSNTCLLFNMKVMDSKTRILNSVVTYNQNELSQDPVRYFLQNNGFAIIGCYPLNVLRAIGGFREDIKGNEDPDLHIRLAASKASFICTNEALVINLVHPHSFSAQNWLRCLSDKLKCLESYTQSLGVTYHDIIGKQAVVLSNYFYKEGSKELSEKARTLVTACGNPGIKSSAFNTFISNTFGVQFYIRLYRIRVTLGLI